MAFSQATIIIKAIEDALATVDGTGSQTVDMSEPDRIIYGPVVDTDTLPVYVISGARIPQAQTGPILGGHTRFLEVDVTCYAPIPDESVIGISWKEALDLLDDADKAILADHTLGIKPAGVKVANVEFTRTGDFLGEADSDGSTVPGVVTGTWTIEYHRDTTGGI